MMAYTMSNTGGGLRYNPDASDTPQAVAADVRDTRSPYDLPSWLYAGGGDTRGKDPSARVPLNVGTNYVLYDNKTGKVLASGSTPEAFKSMSDIVTNQLAPQGRDANWSLFQSSSSKPVEDAMHGIYPDKYGKPIFDKASNSWLTPVGGDRPNSQLGDILGYALPAMFALAPLAG